MKRIPAIALALLVAACGSGAGGEQPSPPDAFGQWELIGGTADGEPFPIVEDGSIRGSNGCRALQGEYVISADQVLFATFSALGECPRSLAHQDGFVVDVLGDGFTVDFDGDRLTVASSGNESLVYHAR